MPKGRVPDSEPTSEEERLAVLLADFQHRRRTEATARVEEMRESAGELFPKLTILADCLGLFDRSSGPKPGPEVPERIGSYRILGRIGAGATSVVYRAEDPKTGRTVALKLMRSSVALIGPALERFRREARAARRLDHPHIVRILDAGEFEGRHYLVMDLVEGPSLADLLDAIEQTGDERPAVSWLELLDAHGVPPLQVKPSGAATDYALRMASLFAPLGGALDAAGEAGLVHRDIKPANLLLDTEGRLRIADFGLVKILDEEMTSVFAVLGTPAYMSPEQARGRSSEVDVRSDLYGVGASLYHALTLDTPVRAKSYEGLMAQIAKRRPDPVHSFCQDYPRSLSRIVARCLEKEPRDRYPDGSSLQEDLERVSRLRDPIHASQPLRRRISRFLRRRRWSLVAAVGVLALVLAGILVGASWLTRPGRLEISTVPEGRIALDGEPKGEGAYAGELSPGPHALRVTRLRFRSHEEQIDVEAGSSRRMTVSLEPEDPFDQIALREILRAHGVECSLPEAEPVAYKGLPPLAEDPWTSKATLVSPRGLVMRGELTLLVHSTEPMTGLAWSIAETGKRAVLHRGTLSAASGATMLGLPDLPPAERGYRVEVSRPGEEGTLDAEFTVGDPTPAREWADGPPHLRALASARLFEEGFATESFLVAHRLADEQPDRTLPWRLTLEALEELGLGGTPVYQDCLAGFEAARRKEGGEDD